MKIFSPKITSASGNSLPSSNPIRVHFIESSWVWILLFLCLALETARGWPLAAAAILTAGLELGVQRAMLAAFLYGLSFDLITGTPTGTYLIPLLILGAMSGMGKGKFHKDHWIPILSLGILFGFFYALGSAVTASFFIHPVFPDIDTILRNTLGGAFTPGLLFLLGWPLVPESSSVCPTQAKL